MSDQPPPEHENTPLAQFRREVGKLTKSGTSQIELIDLVESANAFVKSVGERVSVEDIVAGVGKHLSVEDIEAEVRKLLADTGKSLANATVVLFVLSRRLEGISDGMASRMHALTTLRATADSVQKSAKAVSIQIMEILLNLSLKSGAGIDLNHYEMKCRFAETINAYLRIEDMAILHPTTKEPCVLYAVRSADKAGRYTLEFRKTRKRSGFYKSLLELLPLRLVSDIPRTEGILGRHALYAHDEGISNKKPTPVAKFPRKRAPKRKPNTEE